MTYIWRVMALFSLSFSLGLMVAGIDMPTKCPEVWSKWGTIKAMTAIFSIYLMAFLAGRESK